MNPLQLPINLRIRIGVWHRMAWTNRSKPTLLDCSLMSPSRTGAQRDSASIVIRGTNDSIDCLFAFVLLCACEHSGRRMWESDRTSQFSRIKQRPPATDLSGPKASADSLTPRRSNLAVEAAVDFQFDLFSLLALRLTVGVGGPTDVASFSPGTEGG